MPKIEVLSEVASSAVKSERTVMSRLFATRALMLSAAATTVAFRLAPTMPLGIAGTRSNRMQAIAAPSLVADRKLCAHKL